MISVASLMGRILNPEKQLRERLFQLLSTIALAEFVIVTIYQIIQGGAMAQIVAMCVGTALFAGTVAFTFRSKKMRLGSAISAILYFLLYPVTFFDSGGMYGGAPVVFAFALVYVFLVTEKWERFVVMGLCVAASIACFAVSWLHPELLTRHTVLVEHVESLLSVFLVAVLLCVLFAFVTQVYQTENKIVQEQKREIEELSQSQKRFFSSMSHEIRTPVNAIIGFNEMTLRADVSDEVRENARNIDVASRILLHTINEILDMSKLETGSMEILESDYRAASFLSDIVSMVWQQAREKGLDFRVEVDPELPTVLHGDEVRIRQVLLNIISNAIKYTREGSVVFSAAGRTDGEGTFWTVFDVSDTGIGIREESIPQLFSAFQRVDEHNTHAIEGTGLGLSIVKQLLDLMGGTVSVASEYGKGSTFHVEIPQGIVDATPVGEIDLRKAQEAEVVSLVQAVVAPGIRVLAVDDTRMNLRVVQKLLSDTEIEVDTAASGSEALQKTRESFYDVILMDHQMPEMDGVECLHEIRNQEDGLCRDSKVVCLTANAGAEAEEQYRQEGFDGYLAKPIRGKTLEAEIARLCT